MPVQYNVTDGKMILTLRPDEGGWYVVTSPVDPAMITQARSVPEAFEMARDAFAALATSRSDAKRWNAPSKKVTARRRTQRPVGTGI